MRQVVLPFLGMLATVGIGLLLAEVVPAITPSSDSSILPVLAVQVQSSLQWFLAVFAGAIVARGRFLGAALALTVFGWGAVVYIAFDIARLAADPQLARFAVLNLAGLLFYIVAAAAGALLAKRFYLHRLDDLRNSS